MYPQYNSNNLKYIYQGKEEKTRLDKAYVLCISRNTEGFLIVFTTNV
jgi:hypothetical protein